jgi:hypothetical protein
MGRLSDWAQRRLDTAADRIESGNVDYADAWERATGEQHWSRLPGDAPVPDGWRRAAESPSPLDGAA